MKLSGAWIDASATQRVCASLTDQGYQALFVGGCVRNALLNVPVSDIDIATDAEPEMILKCAEQAHLKAIPTGIDHGTITVVCEGVAHEITTFRADTETDGRHAKVRFSTDVIEDAARRDFTMNAIYAQADGTVIDPLAGMPDLKKRLVRFIGDPYARIREDYLRSLRFFRFTAWYGDPALGIDADGLAAIAENIDGLAGLSRERVGTELKKLFFAQEPTQAVAAMRASGVLSAVLAEPDDRALGPLIHLEQMVDKMPDSIRRLAAIATADNAERLRFSKADKKRWAVLRDEVGDMKSAGHLGQIYGAHVAQDILLLRAALLEMPFDAKAMSEAKTGENAVFPIKAKDLAPLEGRDLGAKLKELEAIWVTSQFTLSKEELLG
ncbi:CCA tRNA nucleotidyltransferase [Planktotalea sp.]|uniref:CCA tRNA nucleotidyltransferase n=1 Tax=Planktotalea sp. TaxID=2029877 RepID=UPI0035C8653C